MIFVFFFTFPEKWKLVSKSAQMVLTWQLISRVLFSNNPRAYAGKSSNMWQVPSEKSPSPLWKNTGGNAKYKSCSRGYEISGGGSLWWRTPTNEAWKESPRQLYTGPPQPHWATSTISLSFSVRPAAGKGLHSPDFCSRPTHTVTGVDGTAVSNLPDSDGIFQGLCPKTHTLSIDHPKQLFCPTREGTTWKGESCGLVPLRKTTLHTALRTSPFSFFLPTGFGMSL